MALEFLNLVLGLLLIFVLPGVMLIKAMFPRPGELDQEYNGIYVLALGMTTSVCITILVGFVLGSIPTGEGEQGYFDRPLLLGSLVSLTLIFFAAGWWRGAFPWMGLLHPKLARFPLPVDSPRGTRRHDELLAKIEELTREHDSLKREVKDLLKRERTHGRTMADHYRDRRVEAEKELERVREELEVAKEQQSKLIYEAKEREAEKRQRRERRREQRESRAPPDKVDKAEKPDVEAEGETDDDR